MKKILIHILIITVLLTGCQKQNDFIENNNLKFGTIINIKIFNYNDNSIFSDIYDLLDDIENKMSTNIDNSEVNRINNLSNNQQINLSNSTSEVIKKGLYYSNLSNGNFDISIEPLVNLWAIGTENEKIPSNNDIENTVKHIDYKKININENIFYFSDENMSIDLGGIAKGYAADKVAELLIENSINKALISLGGNIYALGSNESDEPWKVGIKNPFSNESEIIGYVNVINKSVVTSGIYERYFIEDNKRYHHILNPFTGYPYENDIFGVTIISDNSIDGDALSTIAFSYGIKKGLDFINSLENVDAIFISKDKEVFITKNLNSFVITNDKFTIK
ncbi:FAD:protein FMN transferase [Clostridiaceae bacterium HSG29]|nr:FAD:protein FMN transferase [Clostridiaceae bacterium HSG29]